MTYKEIFDKCVSEQKRKENKYDIWVSFVLRPLSIVCTMPLIGKKIDPTDITKLSVVCCILGFFVMSIGSSLHYILFGWFFFFLWSLLDCIDGNVARCNNACSKLGDLWDTTGGYTAMVLVYFSAGILAFKFADIHSIIPAHYFLIMGSATSVMSIFPRLVMHKKKSSDIASGAVKSISDKSNFSLSQIIAMNIVAPTGGLLLLYLISILFHYVNWFVIIYFVGNLLIMSISLYKLLKKENEGQ